MKAAMKGAARTLLACGAVLVATSATAGAVFFGRLVPTVRTLISVPAGLARMPLPKFLLWSALGSLAWTSLLAVAGYVLEARYKQVEDWINPVSTAVVLALVAIYLWRVVIWNRRR